MNWAELVQTIFTVVLIPLLTILTRYAIAFIQAKAEEIKGKSDN